MPLRATRRTLETQMSVGTTALYYGNEAREISGRIVRVLAVHNKRGHNVRALDRVEVARVLPDKTISPTRHMVAAHDLCCFWYLNGQE